MLWSLLVTGAGTRARGLGVFGVALIVSWVFAGQWVAASTSWARAFTFTGPALAIANHHLTARGFRDAHLAAPAPRDYLSAFIKAGAIFALAGGILLVRLKFRCPRFHACGR